MSQNSRSPETLRRGQRDSCACVWGLDPTAVHDRFWAARGVQVVRPGMPRLRLVDRDLFLLLPADTAAVFDAGDVRRRLRRTALHRQPISIDIVHSEDFDAHQEHLATDPRRRIGFRRRYRPLAHSGFRVLLTCSRALAEAWANDKEFRLDRFVQMHGLEEVSVHGATFQLAEPAAARRCLQMLMRRWRDVHEHVADIVLHRPGVWRHIDTSIDPDARFVPPVWIGAGAHIGRDEVIVGPSVVPDRRSVLSPRKRRHHPRTGDRGLKSGEVFPIEARHRFGERAFNVLFSLFALAATAPLLPLIAAAIWLEDGRPVLFRHPRQTLGGRIFNCCKFRTMCRDADRMKAELLAQNICDGPQFHIARDPRLLRVGRLLRKFHLDELPQFFNVLRGDMNVVGPRPSPDEENQYCPAWRASRLSVRPGMTGLWQVSRTRAPQTDFQEWIRYDLEYVQRRSWRLDLWIIFRTVQLIVWRRRRRPLGGVPHRAGVATEARRPSQPARLEPKAHPNGRPGASLDIMREHDLDDPPAPLALNDPARDDHAARSCCSWSLAMSFESSP